MRACVNVGSFPNECVAPDVSTQAHKYRFKFRLFSSIFVIFPGACLCCRSCSFSLPHTLSFCYCSSTLHLHPTSSLFAFLCCFSPFVSYSLSLCPLSIPCHLCCVSVSGARSAFLPLFLFNACHCKIYGNFVWCFYWICLKNSIPMLLYTYLNLFALSSCCCWCCCCCRPCCRFCCFCFGRSRWLFLLLSFLFCFFCFVLDPMRFKTFSTSLRNGKNRIDTHTHA